LSNIASRQTKKDTLPPSVSGDNDSYFEIFHFSSAKHIAVN